MAKTVKMVIFGKPGEGKSTFASKAPNPFYICTDGNFEWLNLPEDNHIQVSTWKQAKDVINAIVLKKPEYDKYQTIVVDLIEDLYVWAEDEFCKREGIIHIGDYKSMGAGYSVVRKEFFAQISKLLSINKNVILISHEADKIGKTKAGADTYTYIPSDKMSLTKQWNDIEGQVRYFLRCYSQDEEENGKLRKKRYLSLIPGAGEYGICRGADEENWPRECELDWNVFCSIIGLTSTSTVEEEPKQRKPRTTKPKVEEVKEVKEETVKEEDEEIEPEDINEEAPVEEVKETTSKKVDVPPQTAEETVEEVKHVNEPVEQPVDTSKLSPEERKKIVLARIAAMKGKK